MESPKPSAYCFTAAHHTRDYPLTSPSILPHFAANTSFLFAELPILDRFAAAAGFDAVEFHYPYDHDSQDVRDWRLQY